MQRTLMPPYQIHHDFLAEDQQAALLDWTLGHERDFVPTTIAAGKVDPGRRLSLGFRDLGSSAAMFGDRLRALVPGWIEALKLSSFTTSRIELELVAHQDGAFFSPHIDIFTGERRNEKSDRVLSCVYYFYREPKRFSGGMLRLLSLSKDVDAAIDVEPAQNSLVVFPSWVPHEVRRVTCPSAEFADARFAVNGWVHSQSA